MPDVDHPMGPIETRPGYFGVPGFLELPADLFHRCPECQRIAEYDGEGYIWNYARDLSGTNTFLYCVNCVHHTQNIFILGQIDLYSMTYTEYDPARELNPPASPPEPLEPYDEFLARVRAKHGDAAEWYRRRLKTGAPYTRKRNYAQENVGQSRKSRRLGIARKRADRRQRPFGFND
jgi:hypothetical protein